MLETEHSRAPTNRKGEQERDRDRNSNPGSTPLLWGRFLGLDSMTANLSKAVLGILS